MWKSKSPFRPKHKRKNWFFSLKTYDEISESQIDDKKLESMAEEIANFNKQIRKMRIGK